jgi:UDP-3-O-[3-hydroxymyristoyl] glucosamine N-acyltransferase
MEKPIRSWTLAELATLLQGTLVGPADLLITGPAPAGEGGESELTFAGDDKYLRLAEASKVGAILVSRGTDANKPSIQVDHPKAAFGAFLAQCARKLPIEPGTHATAIVSSDAEVDATASIGAYAVIDRGARIGANVRVYPFCYVGEGCEIGADSVLYPHAVLYQDVRLGSRVIVHGGTVLGADGFGYQWDGQQHRKIPQVGGIVIGDDCEIGALSTVDRATMGETQLGRGVKLDNLVMVAHNVRIGEHTVIASQSGVGGSTDIGKRVTLGGQVGIGDHVDIPDDVSLAARSATPNSLDEPGFYKGYPARPITREQRIVAVTNRLPELAKQVKELERRLSELEDKS